MPVASRSTPASRSRYLLKARIEDLNRRIRIALARLPGRERFVCGCSERRGSTDGCEGITSRMHCPYPVSSASIGTCVVECSSKGIRPRVIAQQNIELATVSQRGAASKGGFCNGSAGLRLLRVKPEGRQYTRIGSALPQSSDVSGAR